MLLKILGLLWIYSGPPSWESGNLLEMQDLGPHLRPIRWESVLTWLPPPHTHTHTHTHKYTYTHSHTEVVSLPIGSTVTCTASLYFWNNPVSYAELKLSPHFRDGGRGMVICPRPLSYHWQHPSCIYLFLGRCIDFNSGALMWLKSIVCSLLQKPWSILNFDHCVLTKYVLNKTAVI